MSEHEGFCLPLIEAMHFGLPVVAFAAGAVSDTLGSGGVLVHEKRHAEIGHLLAEISSSAELRERLVRSGRERVEYFSFDRFASRVSELLTPNAEVITMIEGV
jgi:glycosyltransferase involved in cell wall biosynthesis